MNLSVKDIDLAPPKRPVIRGISSISLPINTSSNKVPEEGILPFGKPEVGNVNLKKFPTMSGKLFVRSSSSSPNFISCSLY